MSLLLKSNRLLNGISCPLSSNVNGFADLIWFGLNTTISNLQSQLGNYVPITTYNNEVGSLETLRTTLNKPNATIVSSIIDLDGRL